MELQDASAIAEILGGITIVLTFLFLGLQIRQSNKAAMAAMWQSLSDTEISITSAMLEHPEVWDDILNDRDIEDPIQRRIAIILFQNYMTICENRYRQHKLGYLDDDSWRSIESPIRLFVSLKLYKIWKTAPGYFNRTLEFRRYLDTLKD